MKTRLLMCPPRYFGVSYSINPWMTRNVGYTAPEAQRQWDRLVETLGVAGEVEIELVDPQPGAPDLVFTANAALVSHKLAIVSTFRYAERRVEQPMYRDRLTALGYSTTFLQQTYFEGAGDALFDRKRPVLYAGYGWRSERGATVQLAESLDVTVVPLLLVDERFYHLDVAMCPLGTGHVMAYMDAFSPHAQEALRRTVGDMLIELEAEDALDFACNTVEIGNALVMHNASTRLRERLTSIGYRVFATELSEFLRAGGSAKCLTLKLDDGPVAGGVSDTSAQSADSRTR